MIKLKSRGTIQGAKLLPKNRIFQQSRIEKDGTDEQKEQTGPSH